MMWQNLICVPPMVHPDCTNGQPIICIANPDMYRVPPVFFFMLQPRYFIFTSNQKSKSRHAFLTSDLSIYFLWPMIPTVWRRETKPVKNLVLKCSMGNEGTRQLKQRQLHKGFHKIIDYAHIKAITRNTHLNWHCITTSDSHLYCWALGFIRFPGYVSTSSPLQSWRELHS